MSASLPFADLLAALKERGLPIGVEEHLLVGRLLDRWSGTDLAGLRTALAAVLARSPEEVELVRATFDELYLPESEPSPPPSSPPPLPPVRRRWGRIAALGLALTLIGTSLGHETPPPVEVPPSKHLSQSAPPPGLSPPTISDTFDQPDPVRASLAAAGAALLTFLWLYGVRLRRTAVRLARRRWTRETQALPPPHQYELPLERIGSSLPAAVLDEAARLLGRWSPVPPNPRDLDVDRSIDRTLRAGLAPQIVLKEPASPPSLLVLEDTSGAMHPWRRRVRGLLAELAQRGVPIEVWRVHAGRVFRSLDGEELPLERLARLKSDSPLLVISAGEDFLTGPRGRLASWAGQLALWEHRAWLHPVPDRTGWRPELRRIPIQIWPLTPGGLLAAVRRLAGLFEPPGHRLPVFPDRPVTPFDVDCLRWLVGLAPRRDPDLIELLRREFFPRIPPAALVEALTAPPLAESPITEPAPAEVHAFLASLLATVRVKPGSGAHERWRLDLALQEALVPQHTEAAQRALFDLSHGPLAGEVEQAIERLPGPWRRRLQESIAARAAVEGRAALDVETKRCWHWPDRFEIAAPLLCGLLLFFVGSAQLFIDQFPVTPLDKYDLLVRDSGRPGPFTLLAIRPLGSPLAAKLYRQDPQFQEAQEVQEVVFSSRQISIQLEDAGRGSWYYLRAPLLPGWLAISESVWVGAARPEEQDNGTLEPVGTEMTVEPMDTDLSAESLGSEISSEPIATSEPIVADDSTVRFGTVDAGALDVRGAPGEAFIEESSAARETRPTGTLVITEYPEDLPPGLVHIVGPGQPKFGAPWDGEPVQLSPDTYLLVVQGRLVSLLLESGIEIRAGESSQVQISREEADQIRSLLVGGPKITSVTGRSTDFGRNKGIFDLEIEGEGFSPGARVVADFPVHIATDCTITSKTISCPASAPPFPMYPWRDYFTVRVINPDGTFAEGSGSMDPY